jgi:hypothetical protein
VAEARGEPLAEDGEETASQEDSVRALANYRMCELAIAL